MTTARVAMTGALPFQVALVFLRFSGQFPKTQGSRGAGKAKV